ncbi:MAG: fibronectin type III domain-containing protein [Coriobacteriales bacterium]|nr:fibronectin type III domain-containing protein [Coriobacteriales bacterium]
MKRVCSLGVVLTLASVVLFGMGVGTANAAISGLTLPAPGTTTVNANANYRASVTLAAQPLLGSRDVLNSFVFTFPENTDLSALTTSSFTLSQTGSGTLGSVSSINVVDNGTTKTLTVNLSGTQGAATFGGTTTITISFNALNPSVAGSYGASNTFRVVANGTGGALTTNGSYTLTALATAPAPGTPTLGDSTEWATTTLSVPVTVGPQGRLGADAIPGATVTANRITITLPAGYTVPGSPPASSVTVNGTTLTAAPTVVGRAVTMNVPSGVTVPNNGTVTVAFLPSFGMPNPDAGVYTVTASTDAQTGTGTSSVFTVVPVPTTLSVASATQPAAAYVGAGETRAVGGFTLQRNASSSSAQVTGVAIENAGTTPASTVSGVRVYRDNGDGSYGAGDTVLNPSAATFSGSSAAVAFASAEAVTTTAQQYWIVYTFSGSTDAATASARVSGATHTAGSLNNASVVGSTFTVDSAPPSVVITAPAADAITLGGVLPPYSVSGAAADGVSGVSGLTVQIQRASDSSYWNGLSWQPGPATVVPSTSNGWADWSYGWSFLPAVQDGSETFTITAGAVDGLGLAGQATRSGIRIDNLAPATAAAATPATPDGAGGFYVTTPSVTLTSSESGTTYYKWDGAPTPGDQTEYTAALAPAEGNHTLYYYSVDDAGNQETVSSQNFKVDLTDPVLSIAGVADGAYYDAPVSATVSGSDANGATASATLDGSAYTNGTAIGEGVHTISASASDPSGRSDSATLSFTVDVTAPVVSISGVAEGALYSSARTPTFSVSDAHLDASTATLDGAPFTSGTTVTEDGAHTLVVAGTDLAGNSSTQTVHFTIDTAAPSAPSASGTPASQASINLSWTPSTDAVSGVAEYRVYDASDDSLVDTVGQAVTSTTITGLSPSTTYDYYVRAVDAAGNSSADSNIVSVTTNGGPDTTAPTTSLSATPMTPDGAAGWFKTPPSITLSSNEPGSTYYKWNGVPSEGDQTTYSGAITAAEGENTLHYYSKDIALNAEAPQSTPFKVDSVAPTAANASAVAAGQTSIDVSWSASSEAGSGLDAYRVYRASDNALVASVGAGTLSTTVTGLSPATTYGFYVRAVDTAGNVSAPGTTGSATTQAPPDTTPPVSSAALSPSAPDGNSGWYVNPPQVTISRNEPGTTYFKWNGVPSEGDQTTYSAPFPAIEGDNVLRYYSKDTVGNSETPKATSMKIDSSDPSAPTAYGSATSDTSVSMSWSSSTDSGSGVAGYRVYRSADDSFVKSSSGTSTSITGLTGATTYGFYVRSVDVAGNLSAPGNTVSVTTNEPPGVDVPAGSNVTVTTPQGVGVTFENVTAPGRLIYSALPSAPHPGPSNFYLIAGSHWDVHSTAAFTGLVTVTVPYDPADVTGDEQDIKLFHWENNQWNDVTTSVDTNANTVSGNVTSLSPFSAGSSGTGSTSTPASSWWSLALLGLAGVGLLAVVRRTGGSSA